MARLRALVPGGGLCLAIAAVAYALQRIELSLVGEAFLEALVLAILIGVVVRAAWTPGLIWRPGIQFCTKTLLEVAVVALGASVSLGSVAALGSLLLFGVAFVVATSLAISFGICRALGLPWRMAILIACGNSICGNSAIAAVAPVIGAKPDDVATAIAFTAVLGVVAVLTLPLLQPLLNLSLTQYGVFAGLTVYAVPQVLAATLPIGAVSNQIGTLVKLVRVLMLGPVVLVLSLSIRDRDDTRTQGSPPFSELIPWFIWGFIALSAARSLGFVSNGVSVWLAIIASLLTTVAMSALGLGVDLASIVRAGARIVTAVTTSLLMLMMISGALIWMMRMS
jgi:uncharacterized integral membrane protein (TIGR00698 family)